MNKTVHLKQINEQNKMQKNDKKDYFIYKTPFNFKSVFYKGSVTVYSNIEIVL